MVKCTCLLALRSGGESNLKIMAQHIKKCILDTAGSAVKASRDCLATATDKRPWQHLAPWEDQERRAHEITHPQGREPAHEGSLSSPLAGVK